MGRKILTGALAAGVAATLLTTPASAQQDRVSATEKGSVLIYSKVELRWNAAGALIQDTFIDIANDWPADVRVLMYFINGDPRITGAGGVVIEPGWNWVDNEITLTANEPTYWSAATGLPKGVSPFTVLDPGAAPGRPDPNVPGERMLRGYIIAFAVNAQGNEIRWNHLKGDAAIVNYADTSAWEYNAWSFAARETVQHGQPTATPGELRFDGVEYSPSFDMLLMDFYAVGSSALSGPASLVTVDTDLTLHPLSADLRQETQGPVRTKASFDIWNMNEVKFSGTDRCITCWDQTLLSLYGGGGIPNHFLLGALQTDKGRARIDDIASLVVCPPVNLPPVVAPSIDPLLGVVAKHLTFDGAARAAAGTNLHGLGTQTDGVVRYDRVTPPGEAAGANWLNTITSEVNNAVARPARSR
jgi:hypothetical protein